MTNEEKAKQIAIEIQERIGTSPFSFDSIVDEIMKMAKWKDEQIFPTMRRLKNSSVRMMSGKEARNEL